MYHQLVNITYLGVFMGIWGYLLASVLTMPGEILGWWPKLVMYITRTTNKSDFEWNKVQLYTHKVTWYCAKCIAGFQTLLICVFFASAGIFYLFPSIVIAIFLAHKLDTTWK